jgi:hypothetical protein
MVASVLVQPDWRQEGKRAAARKTRGTIAIRIANS